MKVRVGAWMQRLSLGIATRSRNARRRFRGSEFPDSDSSTSEAEDEEHADDSPDSPVLSTEGLEVEDNGRAKVLQLASHQERGLRLSLEAAERRSALLQQQVNDLAAKIAGIHSEPSCPSQTAQSAQDASRLHRAIPFAGTSSVHGDRRRFAEKQQSSGIGQKPALARLSGVHRRSQQSNEPVFSSPGALSPSPLLRQGPFAADLDHAPRDKGVNLNGSLAHASALVPYSSNPGRASVAMPASTLLPDLASSTAVPAADFTGVAVSVSGWAREVASRDGRKSLVPDGGHGTRAPPPPAEQGISPQKRDWKKPEASSPWGDTWPSKLQGKHSSLLSLLPSLSRS